MKFLENIVRKNKINSKINNISFYCIFSLLIFVIIIFTSLNNGYSQSDSGIDERNSQIDLKNKFIIYINLERINSQLDLSEENVESDNLDKAFSQAYIPHTTLFPNIKKDLQRVSPELSSKLERFLTDLPILIKDNKNEPLKEIKQTIAEIKNTTSAISNKIIGNDTLKDKNFLIQSSIQLLNDASQLVSIHNSSLVTGQKNLEYDSIKGLLERSKYQINKIQSDGLRDSEKNEIMLMYSKIEQNLDKTNFNSLTLSISSLQNYLTQLLNTENRTTNLPDEYKNYFSKINTLLDNVVVEIKENNDYRQADKSAITAYLDNYEYLEAPIEKNDPDLMVDIELAMRENLRKLIKNNEKIEVIEPFVSQIKSKLDNAKLTLENDQSLANESNDGSNNMHLKNIVILLTLKNSVKVLDHFKENKNKWVSLPILKNKVLEMI